MSSNPFRKAGGGQSEPQLQLAVPPSEFLDSSATSSGSTSPTRPSFPPPVTSFRTDTSEQRRDSEDDTAVIEGGSGRRKSKILKKVRVLSPPPLSPDSSDVEDTPSAFVPPPPPYTFSTPPSLAPVQAPEPAAQIAPSPPSSVDPFGSEASGPTVGQAPANPFSKTLEDMENTKKHEDLIEERREEGAALRAANVARGSLDVDAFKRLLMTGHTGEGQVKSSNAAEEAALKISRDIEATRPAMSPEIEGGEGEADDGDDSDSSLTVQFGRRKKVPPPPPPSSRHGKSLTTPPPQTAAVDGKETVEKGSEPAQQRVSSETKRPEIPQVDGEAESAPVSTRKPVPAPPPRRGHARMESKIDQAASLAVAKDDELPPPRSSTDSASAAVPARSNSNRQSGAPAPPPPRRPQPSHRSASLQPSPTSATFNLPLTNLIHTSHHHPDSMISTPTQEQGDPTALRPPIPHHHHTLPPDPPPHSTKLSAPPPPPARNTSVRRPPSVHSTESASRRTSGETKTRDTTLSSHPPPPPPPTRKRGTSRSSVEGPPQRTSSDGGPRSNSSKAREGSAEEDGVPGAGEAILADLDALKREVDALRGKLR